MFSEFVKKYGLLFLILMGAVLLRFSAIGWGFQFDRKLQYVSSVHDDERRELRAIGQMNPRTLDFNPDDAQREGPLHPYIVSAALLASNQLGAVQLSPDESFYQEHPTEMKKLFVVGRAVSVVFGIFEIFLIYLIGKRFFSSSVGLLGAAFMAVLPLEVVQSTYFRSYTLANVLLLGVLYVALDVAGGGARSPWTRRIGALLAGFAFSTRISMAPVLLLLPAADMLYTVHAGGNLKTSVLHAARTFFISTIWWFFIGIGITNPSLILSPTDVWHGMTSQLGYGGSFFDIVSRVKSLLPTLHSLILAVTWPIVLLTGIGIVLAIQHRNAAYNILWLAAAFTIPYGYAVFGSSYAGIPRFTMPFTPFVALFAAYAVAKFFSSTKPGTLSTNTARTCMSVVLAGMLLYPTLYGPLAQLAEFIEKNITPDASIGITWKHAHFKDIDFKKFPNVIELDDTLVGLETQTPAYIILFPYICCDFYANALPQERYEPQLHRYGYEEMRRFRGDVAPLLGIPFSHRIDRQLEYEARIYKKTFIEHVQSSTKKL